MAGHAVLFCDEVSRIFMEMGGMAGRLIDSRQLQFTADQLRALWLLKCLFELRVSIFKSVAGEGTARCSIFTLLSRHHFSLQRIEKRQSRGLIFGISNYI